MLNSEVIKFAPQKGPQETFLSTPADIAIYGGAAGGGKSWSLLYEPLRHSHISNFGCVIFRRTSVQVRNEGGLWHESNQLYSHFNGHPREAFLEWKFPSGARIKFGYLEYEKDVLGFQGAQIPLIGFDELTHFSETQFFYMLSRNRSMTGVPGYVRATCNPDPDSWVKGFIRWWLDEKGEYPIPERSGSIRWFIRMNDSIIWADTPQEIYDTYGSGPEIQPKSVTFIAARLEDNQILMKKDPAYLGNLLALNRVDRERLRNGNWAVRAQAGMLFQREWFQVVDAIPSGWIKAIRFWDRAATKPNEVNKDPDWTRGLLLYKYPNGSYCVGDLRSMRDTPAKVEDLIINTASYDSVSVRVVSQQDPGSAGVLEANYFVQMLAGYDVGTMVTSKDKVTRAKPVSAQCEVGNILVLRAPWNDAFFSELENFNDEGVGHDDIVDAFSGAFNEICGMGYSIADFN